MPPTSILIFFSGLTQPLKFKELLRRVHILHPNVLPKPLLDAIKPKHDELSGEHGLVSEPSSWETTLNSASSVIINVHGSSDGVRPHKTENSSVRCIMGSIDSIVSTELNVTIPIPDSPPFLIGVYKGKEKKSDKVLKPLLREVIALRPPPRRDPSQVHMSYIFPFYYYCIHVKICGCLCYSYVLFNRHLTFRHRAIIQTTMVFPKTNVRIVLYM